MPTSRAGPLSKTSSKTPLVVLVVVLLLGVVLLVGAYVLLPSFLENLVAEDLQDELGLAEKPEVTLEGDPLGLLAGRFEGGRVTFKDLDLDGVRPDRVTVDLEPFDLDVLGSLTSGWIKSEGPLSGDLEVDLSEEEVSRIAASTGVVKGVELEEGRMAVDLGAGNFGGRVPVGVEGSLTLQDGVLRFEPTRAEAFGAAVPQRMLRGAGFSYPISGTLFGGVLSHVEVHKDRLVLSGRVDDLPVG
jgi:hypothetical protein